MTMQPQKSDELSCRKGVASFQKFQHSLINTGQSRKFRLNKCRLKWKDSGAECAWRKLSSTLNYRTVRTELPSGSTRQKGRTQCKQSELNPRTRWPVIWKPRKEIRQTDLGRFVVAAHGLSLYKYPLGRTNDCISFGGSANKRTVSLNPLLTPMSQTFVH